MSSARAASIALDRTRPMLPAAHSRGWESLPPCPCSSSRLARCWPVFLDDADIVPDRLRRS